MLTFLWPPYALTPSDLLLSGHEDQVSNVNSIPKKALSPDAPLWCNPNLDNIYKLPEPYAWTKFNIKTISQIVDNNLSLLKLLMSKFIVPALYFFRYF